MRGLFTAGILDVMMENGIEPDGMVGVSAGACFGCNMKSRQPGRVIRYQQRFRKEPRYMGIRSLLKTGDLIGAEFAYHVMPRELDIFDGEAFAANPLEFHVVCTDVNTGEPVYKQLEQVDYDCLEWIRASASMPIVSRPVPVEGRLLLDGGISDSIPLQYFQGLGYDNNVVILTQPRDYFKKPTRLTPLLRLFMRKYPAITEAMRRRHLMYNAQLQYLARQEQQGGVLVIAPDAVLPISRTSQDAGKMQHVYEMGREAGFNALPAIREKWE